MRHVNSFITTVMVFVIFGALAFGLVRFSEWFIGLSGGQQVQVAGAILFVLMFAGVWWLVDNHTLT